MRSVASLALLIIILGAWSCTEDVGGPETQVMLRIQNEDAQLRASMTGLRVRFALNVDGQQLWRAYPEPLTFSTSGLRWPVDIPIVPKLQDDYKGFEVVIEALSGTNVIAQQRALTSFDPGELRLLELWLYNCPRKPELAACAPAGCQRESCNVCQLDGSCRSSAVDSKQLPRFDVRMTPVSAPAPLGFAGGMMGATGGGIDSGVDSGPGGSLGMSSPMFDAGNMVGSLDAGGGAAGMLDAGGSAAGMLDAGAKQDAGGSVSSTVDAGGFRDAGGQIGGTLPDAGPRDAGFPIEAGHVDMDATFVRDSGGFTGGSLGGAGGGTGFAAFWLEWGELE